MKAFFQSFLGAVAILGALVGCPASRAQFFSVDFSGGGADILIPDATWVAPDDPNNFDIDLGGVTLDMPGAPAMAAVNQITVSLSHTYVGDLTVKLISPEKKEFVLFDQPGGGAFAGGLGIT